jgi:antitoxin (DNA-binding transcriptional repressor) of toxin-antitoxin stability system
MTTVTIDEMQQDLAAYIHRVADGETIVVLEKDRPLAEIKPVSTPRSGRRPIGLCKGAINVPDDFDAPLPDDLLRLFEGR